MTEEKKKWMRQTSAVIKEIIHRSNYEPLMKTDANDQEQFDTRTMLLDLVLELKIFCNTIDNMLRYSNFIDNQTNS